MPSPAYRLRIGTVLKEGHPDEKRGIRLVQKSTQNVHFHTLALYIHLRHEVNRISNPCKIGSQGLILGDPTYKV